MLPGDSVAHRGGKQGGFAFFGAGQNPPAFCRSQIRDSVTARMDEPTREAYAQARAQGRRGAR